jgi:prevent-host-death family protein
MKSVGTYEAKTHLPRLLSRVEKGESITITRWGKPIAKLVPASADDSTDVKQVIEAMLSFRDQGGPVLADDLTIRSLIEEGRP